jgi:acyl-CoA thioester hydrolase
MEQHMTNDQPAPVRIELPLRMRDMDALGHVNQAVYHELLEEVRRAFFSQTLPDLPFTGYVLVHVELDYRREVRIEHGYLTGECGVAELGRSRVELDNRLLLPDGDVAVEGRAVLVAWDVQSRRSRGLTPHEREALLSAEPERLRQ